MAHSHRHGVDLNIVFKFDKFTDNRTLEHQMVNDFLPKIDEETEINTN